MPNVAAVRLTYNPKILWFDPAGVQFERGDALIVRTERGLEYGVAEEGLKEVGDDAIASLRTPLKPVVRKATSDDEISWKKRQADAAAALPVFREMVEERKLDMRPVTVEFLFDGDKAVFYFESEQRVDFRDLVRALASRFHVRIDMRQIGARDEARIVGGLGHCGQELCCRRLGGNFNPVSIRMAKDQDLSLNPQKISGLCGRLMCCLRYEADAYKEFKSRCPKQGSMVSTPKGDAKVIDINVPRETVTLLVDDKRIRVPVARMEPDKKGGPRPNAVSQEVLDECMSQNGPQAQLSAALGSSTMFTGTDKVASNPSARRTDGTAGRRSRAGAQAGDRRTHDRDAADGAEAKKPSRRRRRGRGGITAGGQQAQEGQERARHGQGQGQKHGQGSGQGQKGAQRQQRGRKGAAGSDAAKQGGQQRSAASPKQGSRRPGQHSSGLSGQGRNPASQQPSGERRRRSSGAGGGQAAGAPQQHRTSRRRSHKANGSAENGSGE